jgi:hypothetical protein
MSLKTRSIRFGSFFMENHISFVIIHTIMIGKIQVC